LRLAEWWRSGIRWLLHKSLLLSVLPARLQALEALMPQVTLRNIVNRQRGIRTPVGEVRRRVALVAGCVQQVFLRK